MSLICIQDQDEYFRNGTFASVLFQREIPEKLHGREVLAFLTTPEMYIEPPEEAVSGYSISSACVWEPEHALDWIICGDKILYVGPCEGMGAWQEEEDYETIF